ncbi:MAG: LPS biosynthesis protein [Lachnospiraceae bacterium]
MQIDNNPKEKAALQAFLEGDYEKAREYEDDFVADVRAVMGKENICSCNRPCRFHGKCVECVAIHRAHGDHLPNCLRTIVNDKIKNLCALTENSLLEEES